MSERAGLIKRTIEDAAKSADAVLQQIGVSTDAFARISLNAVMRNPQIANCTPASLRTTLLDCAQRGVLPDGDSAVIVPYKNRQTGELNAQLLMGYKGMCDLVRRSIKGVVLRAQVVTNEDDFEYEEGIDEVLRHKRKPDGPRPTEQNIIAVYALARMPTNPSPEYVVLFKSEIDYIRSTYANAKSPAWTKEYAEQAKKTALRRLCKTLPIRSGLIQDSESEVSNLHDQVIDAVAHEGDPDPAAEPGDRETPQPARRPARRTRAARKTAAPAPPPEPEPPPEPAPPPEPEQPPEPEPNDALPPNLNF